MTASFGVGQRSEEINSVDTLVNAADMALYHSKSTSRNAVTMYGEDAMIPYVELVGGGDALAPTL